MSFELFDRRNRGRPPAEAISIKDVDVVPSVVCTRSRVLVQTDAMVDVVCVSRRIEIGHIGDCPVVSRVIQITVGSIVSKHGETAAGRARRRILGELQE